jgi:transcriptional regulator with XRE-family HTH domain
MKPDKMTPEQRLILVEIGKRLQELRKSKNIGSKEMADLIGVSRNGYSMMEHGKTFFKFSKLMLLLQYHQTSYSEFFKNL